MMLEILAGRLLAPYIGVSLYTWTSIIGVILAGVSLGNWLGGVWSDRGADERNTAIVLLLSGTTCLTVLLILTWIAPYLQTMQLSPLTASFIYVCALFFVPAFFIGIITPVLTTLALHRNTRTGHIVGMMHALAAAGSIVGTFLAGYWLIQYFGTHFLIVVCSIIFFLLSIPFFIGRMQKRDTAILALIAVVVFFTYQREGYTNPCKRESQYYCIRIVSASDMAPFGFANGMVIDNLLHGINHATRPDMLIYHYLQAIDEIVQKYYEQKTEKLNWFFAGGGAYTLPRAVRAMYPQAEVTVAEIDPVVTSMAAEFMNVEFDSIKVIHRDARMVLPEYPEQHFDVIVGDVYHDVSLPYHLATKEYAQMVRSRLKPDGIYMMNILDADYDPILVKSIFKTLQTEFRYVNLWLEEKSKSELRQTFVISASNHHDVPQRIMSSRGFNRSWTRINDKIAQHGEPMTGLPVLTDDYVPVERLVSALIFEKKK